jgi:hypothetical protein
MATAQEGPSVTAFYGDAASCKKHLLFPIDFAAALLRPDAAKWAVTAQSATVHDMTKPVQWRDK